MWLVRKQSGEPVFFQCAVLPLEDYPMSARSVTYDACDAPNQARPALEASAAVHPANALLDASNGLEQQAEKVESRPASSPQENVKACPAPQQLASSSE